MRIAVTGGGGFIGSHVVDRLVEAGHHVDVVDLRPPHRSDVGHHEVNIGDLEGLTRAFRGMDVVFHLAAVADVNDAEADPVGTVDANVGGTANVWEACRRNEVSRAVLASTVWVYAGAVGDDPLDEEAPFRLPDAGHLYTSTKLAAELVVHSYHTLYGQEFTILRYGIPYGPRMRDSLVIPKFVRMALDGTPITLQGDGSQYRNYVYVEDLADAHVLALGKQGVNQVFNLEGSVAVSIRQLVDSIGAALGRAVEVQHVPARAGDYGGREVSAAHAATVLGWSPQVEFSEGLRRYVDWHLAERREPVVVAAAEHVPAIPAVPAGARPVNVARTAIAAVAAGLVLVPALTGGELVFRDRVAGVVGAFVAAAVAVLVSRYRSHAIPAAAAAGLAVISVWLVSQATPGPTLCLLGAMLGLAIGSRFSLASSPGRRSVAGAAAGAAGLVAAAAIDHSLFLWLAIAAGGALLLTASPRAPTELRRRRSSRAFTCATVLVTAGAASWVGASSASASWFGTVTSHGSRQGQSVAITFDGLADAASTRIVLHALDARGAKATFFLAADDVKADPQLARTVMASGHLLANRGSGRSNAIWLGLPPDVRRTQRELAKDTGRCPTYYRPPKGRHTPLTARAAKHQGMAMVTWDVRAEVHPHDDAARLTSRLLEEIRPGSIVKIHLRDLRGRASTDTLLSESVPLLLDGLRARGLKPVRLDQLLHTPGYERLC